jgi:hypothetical protein
MTALQTTPRDKNMQIDATPLALRHLKPMARAIGIDEAENVITDQPAPTLIGRHADGQSRV